MRVNINLYSTIFAIIDTKSLMGLYPESRCLTILPVSVGEQELRRSEQLHVYLYFVVALTSAKFDSVLSCNHEACGHHNDLFFNPNSWLIEKAESHTNENGEVVTNDPDTAVLLGLRKATNPFTPVADIVADADFVYRRSKKQWWMQMRTMMKILACHESSYAEQNLPDIQEDGSS